jgi:hypothetical protein
MTASFFFSVSPKGISLVKSEIGFFISLVSVEAGIMAQHLQSPTGTQLGSLYGPKSYFEEYVSGIPFLSFNVSADSDHEFHNENMLRCNNTHAHPAP